MANRSADFNYKVALASGLKSLQGGRLRQAEEQFRYLVHHFPTADGGYRGLAKVLVEQEDRPGALKTLIDGGAKLAKSGHRSNAISLYREAVSLDGNDLAAHRRLAAALALSGETEEAAHEYVRFIASALATNASERAQLEAEYALERLPGNIEVEEAARSAGATIPAPVVRAAAQPSAADREAMMRSAFGGMAPAPAPPPSPATAAEWNSAPPPSAWDAPAPTWTAPPPAPGDPWAAPPAAEWGAEPQPAAAPTPEPEPIPVDAEDETVEATAARYLAKRDPRGGTAALEAARRYMADGRMDAASDLLLQLIAAGIADHEAQRLLVEVTKSLGKRDVAKAKVQLLVEALRLDGHAELAAEVEQLAQAF